MALAPDDPRHGLNGYSNLGCRCDVCKQATSKWHHDKYARIDTGEVSVDLLRRDHQTLKAYAAARGLSVRQVAIRAIREYMAAHPSETT
jgi:hypothetical protein